MAARPRSWISAAKRCRASSAMRASMRWPTAWRGRCSRAGSRAAAASGSTGTRKAVMLSHQSHIWVAQTRLAPGLDRHRYLIAAPLYHMNALALSLLACAAHASNVLLPQFGARAYIEAIERYRCTWLTAVPPMIAMMLREHDLLARTDVSSVEFIRTVS